MVKVKGRDTDYLMALAKCIRDHRERASLTQEDLAFAAGLSVRHYQSIESGNRNPSILALRSISLALSLPLSRLVSDIEKFARGGRKRAT